MPKATVRSRDPGATPVQRQGYPSAEQASDAGNASAAVRYRANRPFVQHRWHHRYDSRPSQHRSSEWHHVVTESHASAAWINVQVWMQSFVRSAIASQVGVYAGNRTIASVILGIWTGISTGEMGHRPGAGPSTVTGSNSMPLAKVKRDESACRSQLTRADRRRGKAVCGVVQR